MIIFSKYQFLPALYVLLLSNNLIFMISTIFSSLFFLSFVLYTSFTMYFTFITHFLLHSISVCLYFITIYLYFTLPDFLASDQTWYCHRRNIHPPRPCYHVIIFWYKIPHVLWGPFFSSLIRGLRAIIIFLQFYVSGRNVSG